MSRPLENRVGERYGRLVVIERIWIATGDKRETGWACQCDCGNKVIVRNSHIKTTKSCGCLRMQGSLPQGEAAFNRILAYYIANAKKYGRVWRLSREQFRELTKQPCHYCGGPPSKVSRIRAKSTGVYVYSGVDRKDNSKGYIEGNVVSCCEICNRAKRAMDYDDFVAWINRIKGEENEFDRNS